MSTPSFSRILALTAFFALCIVPIQSMAQIKPTPAVVEGRVTLDFNNVDLKDLIKTISELTGKNFLYDETVQGKVSVVSPDTMSLDEAYQLFLTVLNVKGYTVVPTGNINKIVPLKDAKGSNLPTIVNNGQGKATEQVITRVFHLKHLDAAIVAPTVLFPLMPNTSNVAAYAPSNSLIITDTGANIERLAKIISDLDVPEAGSDIEVIVLKNSKAEDLAKILTDITTQPAAQAQSRRHALSAGGNEPVTKIVPYPAGHSLIVMAGKEDMATIKNLISRMDRASNGPSSNINLYYLENADAVTLAKTLNEILTGIKAESKEANKTNTPAVTTPGGPLASGQQLTGQVTVTADKPTNALIVNASADDYKTIKSIIEKLDIKRKQVYVEALILELSMDATRLLGAQLQGAGTVNGNGVVLGTSNLNNGQAPVGLGTLFSAAGAAGAAGASGTTGTATNPLTTAIGGLMVGGFFDQVNIGTKANPTYVPALSVLIDLSKTNSDINLLSAPRLLTSDNEEAEIIVGENVPIITGRLTGATGVADTSSTGLAQSVSVERQDVALKLRFTPQITEGNLVRLNVYQEITDIAPSSAAVGDPSQVGPTFTKRVLRNTVLVEDHKTVVLGGLISTNVTESVTKVPLLGDIPGVGWLFKHTSTEKKKTNLLIFINPTIIKSPEDLERVTGRNRKTALDSVTDKVREAVPENFFEKNGDQNAAQVQGAAKTETTGGSGAKTAPADAAPPEASATKAPHNWVPGMTPAMPGK
jgi:general secretion pathway protein D